jgi:hypothetical protein
MARHGRAGRESRPFGRGSHGAYRHGQATLLSAGRLQRTTAPADRRRTHLSLTAAGSRVYAQVVPMALKYERQLVAPLSKSELATLDRVLRVLLGRAVELGPAHVQ